MPGLPPPLDNLDPVRIPPARVPVLNRGRPIGLAWAAGLALALFVGTAVLAALRP